MKRRLIILGLLVLLSGCSGGGPDTFTTPPAPEPTFTASSTSINPGEAVALSWTGIADGANFDVKEGTTQSVFKPYVTETYLLALKSTDQQIHTIKSVTVNVKPGNEKYVIIGDETQSPFYLARVKKLLQALTTTPVVISPTLPNPIDADVVVIEETARVSPTDVPALVNHLKRGKGLVMEFLTPGQLATGDANNPDYQNISSWFGASKVVLNTYGSVQLKKGLFVPIPITAVYGNVGFGVHPSFGGTLAWGPYVTGLAKDADYLPGYATGVGTSAFGYRPPIGGRVWWMLRSDVEAGPLVLASASRWAAIGP